MIICIVGPTGVGKTKMSVALAHKYNAVIVNCDAMQVYKELNIGTAKVTEEEKEGVPHILFDIADVEDFYTVYDYQAAARKVIEENKDKNIIFVGGTGLYLKAALYNYQFSEETNEPNNFDELSNEELYKKCLEKDPKMDIHINNRKRLIRFLNKEDIELPEPLPLYKHTIIGLTTDRETLYQRINDRVDQMVKDGLIEEVKSFYDKGLKTKSLMTGIGYKELYDYFDKKVSLDEALDNIKKNSRHYAKRQYTFFNHQLPVNWFDVNFKDFNKTIEEVENFIDKEKED